MRRLARLFARSPLRHGLRAIPDWKIALLAAAGPGAAGRVLDWRFCRQAVARATVIYFAAPGQGTENCKKERQEGQERRRTETGAGPTFRPVTTQHRGRRAEAGGAISRAKAGGRECRCEKRLKKRAAAGLRACVQDQSRGSNRVREATSTRGDGKRRQRE